jgi:hypothetical protein
VSNEAVESCWAMTQAAGPPCCGRSGSIMLEFIHPYTVGDVVFCSDTSNILFEPDVA